MPTATITREDEETGTEYEIEVTYSVSKYYPAVHTLRNGDPGYPAEGGEVEVSSAIRQDTGEEVELTDAEIESIAVDAETDDGDYEPDDYDYDDRDEREYEPYDYDDRY
jgi:hypothetical protein